MIGKGGVYISEDSALNHIADCCVINDVSERHFQLERGGQWDKRKGCDSFGPIGHWLVTALAGVMIARYVLCIAQYRARKQ